MGIFPCVALRVTYSGITNLRVTSQHAKVTSILTALTAVTDRLNELLQTTKAQWADSTTVAP